MSLWMKSLRVTIHMKVKISTKISEDYFSCWDIKILLNWYQHLLIKFLGFSIKIKDTELHFAVQLFII